MPRGQTLRLAPVAGATWLAALGAIHLPQHAAVLAATLWLAVLAALAWFAYGRRPRRGARLAVMVTMLAAAGAAATASHVAVAEPARHAVLALEVTGGRAVAVQATVVGKVEGRADGTLAFDAIISRIAIGTAAHLVRAEAEVRVAPDDVDIRGVLDVGAEVVAQGTAHAGRPGDRAVLVFRADRGLTVARTPDGAAAATASLRTGLVAAVRGLPGGGAGLVPGLAVGDTSAVSHELSIAMKESSLSHLTAVSGANCALVVGLAFLAASAAGASRQVRVGVGLAVLAGFVLLVTPEPSVVRAATMSAIAMLGVLLGRPAVGMAFLSLGVALLLVTDPWLAGSLGFALSTAATASLLLFARPLARGLERVLPRALALGLSVPLAAQLACGPLIILVAPQIPVYGVLANLIAAPAAPIATVVGLAACLAAPFPPLQSGLAAIAWVPASWIAATATTVSSLPGDTVPWLEGWPGVLALAVVGTAIGTLIALHPRTPAGRGLRRSSGALVAIVIGVVAGGGLLGSVVGRWTLPADWSVLACDIGQGDAVLLRSNGVVALIDTGPDPETLGACLDRVGVSTVDLLVLTHFDLDHAGGAAAVEGRVGTVLHGPPHGDAGVILDRLARAGARLQPVYEGLSGELGRARWSVLWPRADGHAFPPGNDASIVLDVRGGGIPPTLLLGDLSASPQRAIASSGSLRPPYAVVKVAHHGSADQEPALYRAATPSIAIITVGADNDYGHPRAEILDTLASLGAVVARTDAEGIVAVRESGGALEVWRERGG